MQQELPGSHQDQVQVRVQVLALAPVACAGGLSAQPARWRLQGRISKIELQGPTTLLMPSSRWQALRKAGQLLRSRPGC